MGLFPAYKFTNEFTKLHTIEELKALLEAPVAEKALKNDLDALFAPFLRSVTLKQIDIVTTFLQSEKISALLTEKVVVEAYNLIYTTRTTTNEDQEIQKVLRALENFGRTHNWKINNWKMPPENTGYMNWKKPIL